MKSVYKYALSDAGYQSVAMPEDAEILTARPQNNVLCVWALVDTERPPVLRHFVIVPTGEAVVGASLTYIGQIVLSGAAFGELVGHLFEVNRL